MALGVMTLITVMSVMNGFDNEIKTRILQVVPHGAIEAVNGLDEWQPLAQKIAPLDNVEAVTPYVAGQAMLSFRGRVQGVVIHGVLPEQPAIVGSLGQQLLSGSLALLQPRQYNIILGRLLAEALGVRAGDSVLLTLPEVTVTPAGVYPRVKKMTVAGIFEVGAQVDSSLAFMHLSDAAKLLRMNEKVTGLRLFFTDPFDLASVSRVRSALPDGYRLTTWRESMSELFAAIRMEKTVVGLLLSVIIGVAAFNIVASLVLMVNEKRTDIAVLRTLGSSSGCISRIFQIQGGLTGVAGVLIGVAVGCVLAVNVGDVLIFLEHRLGFSLFDPELYFITRLPSQLQWLDVAIVAFLGIVLSIVATWYPALRAGRVPPAEALRYE